MSDDIVWHDLENGSYSADLPLWRELAADTGARQILEIGSGTGRVALDLARRGHALVALEREAALAQELRRRSAGLPVEVVHADACAFALPAPVGACIVPMQAIQLLGDRTAFFRCAHAAIEPGGLLALAVLPQELYAFEVELDPDVLVRDGQSYLSYPTALRKTPSSVVLERRRQIIGDRALAPTLDIIELARISIATLSDEGTAAGFARLGTRSIAPTDQHAGSDVLLLSRVAQ
jgi:SAM-dependent methyltransferase